ncbi:MAG TPA: WG repeat-containing protein, partial [Ohtaekwangia sp.]|nr:WG repeat-containing protein [Ohtaekwangia sp.]
MKAASCFFGFLLITFFSAAHNYTVFEENGKVGLKNDQGEVLIPAQYQALGWSNGELSFVNNVTGYQMNGLWGLIDLSNHKVTKPTFETIIPGEGSLLIAQKKSPLSLRIVAGCVTTEGKEVIPFSYDGVKIASLRAIVFTKIGNEYKYGLIDLENKTLIPQQYKNVRSIGSLRYAVEDFSNRIALFTEAGKQISSFNIDTIGIFTRNYAIIHQNLQQGLIDRNGEIKLEPKFREIVIREDGTIHARQADEWYFLDGANKLIQKTLADKIEPVGKNLLKVSMSGNVMLTDPSLKPVTSAHYKSLSAFQNGKAVFQMGDKYGLIRKDGSVVIPAHYNALVQDRQFVLARQRERWMLLDSLGEQRSAKSYDNIMPFNGKYFAVQQRGYWGAIDFTGKEALACSYDSLLQALDNLIVVKFRGQYGIMTVNDE